VNPAYAVGTASGVINFNGDDLVILSTTNTTTAWANRLDVVGDGSTWGVDKSFVRKASVLAGNATWTLAEWTQATLAAVDGAAAGSTERLGAHLYGATNTVTAAITAPSADVTVASGAPVNFTGAGTDSSPTATLGYAWTFGDGATATGAATSHAFSNTTASNLVRSVTLTVTDDTGVAASATRNVTVTPAADTISPTVSATESGTAGTITLAATASDNVGVTQVEFYVDGVLKGTDTTSPYSLALDSTTLSNASHSLTGKAFDAAGNNATSTPVSFTINNPVVETQMLLNPGFESGAVNWTATSGVITSSTSRPARTGSWKAWLNGRGTANTQTLYQQVAIPSSATSANLAFWVRIDTAETTTTQVWDTLKVQVRNSSGALLAT
jgi:hypothetical protein